MKNEKHIEMRSEVEFLLREGHSLDEIAKELNIPIGTCYVEGSAKWYNFCLVAKMNQKRAIEKHPKLYSEAGKIAQQKHPWLGHELGKKYGKLAGKIAAKRLEGNSEYFSKMAKRLHELNPEHSKLNMIKAHQTMKQEGSYNRHQAEAALSCKKKHPNQLKDMSKRAHELYPLALLALESRRKHYPYEFMGCFFDSNSERNMCEILVINGLINRPEEGQNVHFRINRCHVDFFIEGKVFVEFHPPLQYGRKKGETLKTYYEEKRKILDENGYKSYPLVVIGSFDNITPKLAQIKELLTFELDKGK